VPVLVATGQNDHAARIAVLQFPVVWPAIERRKMVAWCDQSPDELLGVLMARSSAKSVGHKPRCIEELRQCLAVIAERNLAPTIAQSVHRQIDKLLSPEEWEQSEVVPLAASFGYVVAFLAKNNELHSPSITVANENFVLSYLKNRDRMNAVHLEFDNGGWVTFIVSLFAIGHDSKGREGVMTVPLDEVRSHLELLRVWDWLVA
jgi:hypothetical protein